FDIGMGRHVQAADDVDEMAELVEVDAAGAVASAGIDADGPHAAVAGGGPPEIPFASDAEAGQGAVGVLDARAGDAAGAEDEFCAVLKDGDGELRIALAAAL